MKIFLKNGGFSFEIFFVCDKLIVRFTKEKKYMKKWKKLLFCIFLLPVIFVMSGCTPFGGDSTLTTEQTQESTTDQTESEGENQKPQQPVNPDHETDENEKPNEDTIQPEKPNGDMAEPENPAEEEKPAQPDSSNKPDNETPEPENPSDDENVTQPEEPTEPEEKPTVPEVPGEDLTQPDKPSEDATQPENPDGDMAKPEIPAEPESPEEKPTKPEENQFFIVDFEVKCFDSTTAAIQKSDTPMSISAMYPDIQIQSNDGILFFVEDDFNSQYAIHFKHSHEKEICTTLENGKQVLEFDIYYSIPFCQSTIFVNGNAIASLPFTVGFEKMTVRVEVFSNSTFTLDLTAIM